MVGTTSRSARILCSVGNRAKCWTGSSAAAAPSSNAGIFELYRQRAEEARGQQAEREQPVWLRVPVGIGQINMLHRDVAAGGTMKMWESAAKLFLRAEWVRVDASDLRR